MPKIPTQLNQLIEDNQLNELTSGQRKKYEYPIYIAPQKTFPTDLVVKYNSELSLDQWIEDIKSSWKSLKKPSLRVFLPNNIADEDFLSKWNEEDVQLGIVTSKAL